MKYLHDSKENSGKKISPRYLRRSAVPMSSMLSVVALSAFGSLAQSAPTVTGMSINMPDDGWYQVQSSSDYSKICAGVRSCEVPAGSYIVVNHTTGERFEDVIVNEAIDSGSEPTVSGNTISWPDNGWYQVQDATAYASLCQGGRSCEVGNGAYIVINHTTGQRFEGVIVDQSAEPGDEITVTAGTISWPDDGWYQVQGVSNYAHVCQGGRSCSVAPGTYIVINHTTGMRWENVEVAEGTGVEADLSVANAEQIVADVIAVINEEAIDALYETAQQDLGFQGKVFSIRQGVDELGYVGGGDLDEPYQLELVYGSGNYDGAGRYDEYTCPLGGGLTYYYAAVNNYSDTEINGCVTGSNTYSGTSGNRSIPMRGVVRFFNVYDLSITDSAGNSRTVSGGYESVNIAYNTIDARSGWRSAQYLGPVENGELQVDDYSVIRTTHVDKYDPSEGVRETLPDGTVADVVTYQVSRAVEGSFEVTAPWSAEKSLSVAVNLSFRDDVNLASDVDTGEPIEFSGTDPREEHYWQSGSIDIAGADGSTLSVTPVEGDRDSFLITTDSGETIGPLQWADGFSVYEEVR